MKAPDDAQQSRTTSMPYEGGLRLLVLNSLMRQAMPWAFGSRRRPTELIALNPQRAAPMPHNEFHASMLGADV
jgi:hypothetical protein